MEYKRIFEHYDNSGKLMQHFYVCFIQNNFIEILLSAFSRKMMGFINNLTYSSQNKTVKIRNYVEG